MRTIASQNRGNSRGRGASQNREDSQRREKPQSRQTVKNKEKPDSREKVIGRKRFRVLPDQYGQHYDHKLLITIIVLCCFGLIMVYSSSAYVASTKWKNEYFFVIKEAVFMGIGFIMMLLISKLDYHWFVKFTAPIYLLSVFLMFLVDATGLGVEVNGQKRWINLIPGVKSTPTYQPTEIVKIAVILVFAYMINRCIKNIDRIPVMCTLLFLLIPPALLVLVNNLSSGIIITGVGCFMYFMASRRKKLYWIILIAVVTVVTVIYINPDILAELPMIEKYQLTRIKVWKDPSADPRGTGYQVLQGLYAIGSGGLFGKGLGSSVQKLGFIPESHNDMIFSIICEELGIFGAVCVIGLFAYMIYRFVYIILRAQDLYGAMIVAGVMIHIALQVILNIAVVTNSIPNTGVTLPFISYGGTSVAILLAEMGMVLSVSNQIIYEK
ncbi:MAG: putative peptidoglycan glycosyltransferase FtsW [Lachnospiraceae bacterium]|nr:putative peptidoglycan glycosyltransferase FtsW [Lachnospiraceae bacterium]